LSLRQLFYHPAVVVLIAGVLYFAVVKRLKAARIALFSLPGIALIVLYGIPEPDVKFTMLSMAPLIGGGVFIAAVIIYYTFIKTD
jgi:drug/metabolite transporter superfamily protein YnfA